MEFYYMRHKATGTVLVDKRGFLQVYRRTAAKNPHWYLAQQTGHPSGWERVPLVEWQWYLAHSQFAEEIGPEARRQTPGQPVHAAAGGLRDQVCLDYPDNRFYQVGVRDGALLYELVYLSGGYAREVKTKSVTEAQMRDDPKLGDGRFLWDRLKLALSGQDPDNVVRNARVDEHLQALIALDLSRGELARCVAVLQGLEAPRS